MTQSLFIRASHLLRWALIGIFIGGALYALLPVSAWTPTWLAPVSDRLVNLAGLSEKVAGGTDGDPDTDRPDLRFDVTDARQASENASQDVGQDVGQDADQNTDLYTGGRTGEERGQLDDRFDGQRDDERRGRPAASASVARERLSYHQGIMRVAPSVVSLFARTATATSAKPTGAPAASGQQQGSGVIIDPVGLVLTNFHLIDGAEDIEVVLNDGARHRAVVVGSDRETDLAVLRIDGRDLPAVPIDSGSMLHVGDIVLAIGNPFGVGQTVTQGIVSATGRQVAGGSAWQHFVQIDAAINPGNSGGALIDPLGRLVGVTSAVLRGSDNAQGISFAIPGKLLAQVVPQIIAEGRVRRGWLGIGADDVAMFPELARHIGQDTAIDQGAVITNVLEGSPADTSDLRLYDVVTKVNGLPVRSANELLLQVSGIEPDNAATLTINRAGEELDLDVALGERPSLEGSDRP